LEKRNVDDTRNASAIAAWVYAMKRIFELLTSTLPLVIVGGLLYAGLFIKPQPKGAAVSKPIFERADRFYGIAAQEGGNAWLAGSNGKIVRTQDGGHSWTLQEVSVGNVLQDIAAWDTRRAVAVGNGGVVITTSDGGQSWRSVDAPKSRIANKLMRIKVLPNGEAWCVGEGGSILHSTNFGASWQQQGTGEDAAWNDITFKEGHAWLVGEFGHIKRSDDGGATWQDIVGPVKTSLMSVAFKDAEHGVAVGLNGVILTSDDGGHIWTRQVASSPDSSGDIASRDDHLDPAKRYERGQLEHLFDIIWDGERWIAVGSKGVIVIGSANGLSWRGTRLSSNDRNWYTAIARVGGQYYLAGSRVITQPIQAF
jgi:photosystem II stability/assembly factor-like uncharacterized protein